MDCFHTSRLNYNWFCFCSFQGGWGIITMIHKLFQVIETKKISKAEKQQERIKMKLVCKSHHLMTFCVSVKIFGHKNSGKLNTENSRNAKSIYSRLRFSRWTKGFGNLIALKFHPPVLLARHCFVSLSCVFADAGIKQHSWKQWNAIWIILV